MLACVDAEWKKREEKKNDIAIMGDERKRAVEVEKIHCRRVGVYLHLFAGVDDITLDFVFLFVFLVLLLACYHSSE